MASCSSRAMRLRSCASAFKRALEAATSELRSRYRSVTSWAKPRIQRGRPWRLRAKTRSRASIQRQDLSMCRKRQIRAETSLSGRDVSLCWCATSSALSSGWMSRRMRSWLVAGWPGG